MACSVIGGLFCYLDLLNVIVVMFDAILSYKLPPVVYGEHCTKIVFQKKRKIEVEMLLE